MEISINGEHREVSGGTIASLLVELQLSGKRIAVERNRDIVRREQYGEVTLAPGDQIEIIHFVGGG